MTVDMLWIRQAHRLTLCYVIMLDMSGSQREGIAEVWSKYKRKGGYPRSIDPKLRLHVTLLRPGLSGVWAMAKPPPGGQDISLGLKCDA